MLRKFCRSKTGKIVSGVILALAIYYTMTDGFTQTLGEAARVGADANAAKAAAGSGNAEWVVIGILSVWILLVLGKNLWEKYRRKPKNDVNVRY